MDFKLVSKNNVGAALLLLFIVIVSQSKMLNFLLNTYLGRAFLILLILVLAYLHKIFGVVAVLFVILLFNQSDMAYLEGFVGQDASGNIDPSGNVDASGSQVAQQVSSNVDASGNAGPPPAVIAAAQNNASTSSQSNQVNVVTPGTPTTGSGPGPASNANIGSGSGPASTKNTALEGFNILGMENEIRRGKNSNTLPVNPFMKDATNVAPYEGSPFKENFSLF